MRSRRVATGRPAGIHPLFLLPHILAFRYNDGQFFDKLFALARGRARHPKTRPPHGPRTKTPEIPGRELTW